ncbi:MAG: hypothetical protein QOE92_1492 [Chloroflexota bacterium]|jgi:hypothetical protein|nr:hypothetical protein [Chloroflexota bacterium]
MGMARRVIVDYGGPIPGERRLLSRRRVIALVGVLAVLAVAVFGATEGRELYRQWRDRPTADSHPVDSDTLDNLQPVGNPASIPDDEFDGRHQPTVWPSASPSPRPTAVLKVPYSVQAPRGNWKVFEEACEEDVLLMYHDYLDGDHRDNIPADEADPALRALQQWQVTNWGGEKDLTLERTGQLAEAYYGYKYEVMTATIESIKAQVSLGRPVIIPVMTHSLQNPHYGPKSVYHEVLIKGYKDDGVVTNDGGVQEGKNWFYSWSVMFGAIDAQTPKMSQGRLILVLSK